MSTQVSYKNDVELKSLFVAEIIRHRKADQILQGTYGKENGKWQGCAVGCSIHSLNLKLGKSYDTSDHSVYETELGIPEWMARLEDTIFEGLPKVEAMRWPERFAKAVPVGVNLEPVKWKFCAFILKENIERVLTLKISDNLKKQVVDALRGVLTLHETAIKTGNWAKSSSWSAESAARSAARSAESAAESAARSAAESARSAAWSARSAARSAEYVRMVDKLIQLLKEAPVK